jgi:hypothetical protein
MPLARSQNFCRLISTGGLFPKAPVYGGNDWYFAYGKSTGKMILGDAPNLIGRTLAEGFNESPLYGHR